MADITLDREKIAPLKARFAKFRQDHGQEHGQQHRPDRTREPTREERIEALKQRANAPVHNRDRTRTRDR